VRISALAFLFGYSLAVAQPSITRFDGTWNATISCPNLDDGTRGYTYKFAAEVKDGVLKAQHRVPDSAGSLRVEGTIPPDGVTELHAYGRTGNPDFAVTRPNEGTPYSFRIKAKFDETRGSGERLDSRPCSLVFSKR
jgi:hypothetical protein